MSSPAQTAAPLGRVAECEALEGLLEAARGGASGTLVARGETGVGKTTLLDYAIDASAGMCVGTAGGIEGEMDIEFGGLHQLLAPLLAGLEDLPTRQRSALSSAFGLGEDESPERSLVGVSVLSVLSNVAETQPVLCVVDDAQWLDQTSAETIAFVARRLPGQGIAFLFSLREPAEARIPLDGLPELRLEGLEREAARTLLRGTIVGPLDRRVEDRIIAETGGNPASLLEIAADLTPAQLAGGTSLPDTLLVGGRLEQSFLRRVRRLPPETQSLLLLLAAESEGDADLFWRAAHRLGLGPAASGPAELEGLIRVGPHVTFRHPSIRSAVYGAAQADVRRRVHRALAAAVDPELDGDRKAWHRAAASTGPDEDIAAALERSAERAGRRGGCADTAAFLKRSAQLTPDHARRVRRTLAAARAELAAGALDDASALLAEAGSEPADELQRAQAQRLSGALALALGENGHTSGMLLEAARTLEPLDPQLARDTHLEALAAALYAGPLGVRGSVVEAARAALARPAVPESQATAGDLLLDGFASLLTEGHAAGAPSLRRAIENIRDQGDLDWIGLAYLGAIELWDDEAVRALATRRVELARAGGALTALPNALCQLGGYEVIAGRFEAAEACFEEAHEISAATGNVGIIGETDPGALIVAAWRGEESRTRTLAEDCMRDATARGLGTCVSFAHYALAVLQIGLGHYEGALIAAREASLDPSMSTRTLPELVEAAARSGEPEAAAAAVRRLADTTRPTQTEWGLGILARSRALLAEGGAAEDLYEEALDHLKRCRATPQLARARLLYGEWLRRERRRRDAREQLIVAYEMFASMGADAFAERALVELSASGEHPRRRAPENIPLLTPQELRIARLVSEGATNADIAAQLFISPRTVEYHLHKVFRKLDVSSRTQLTRNLLEGGDGRVVAPRSRLA